jgi:hypothetical protein
MYDLLLRSRAELAEISRNYQVSQAQINLKPGTGGGLLLCTVIVMTGTDWASKLSRYNPDISTCRLRPAITSTEPEAVRVHAWSLPDKLRSTSCEPTE